MNRISNLVKPILMAACCSAAISFCIVKIFAGSPQNYHWIYSLCFHAVVAFALALIIIMQPDAKTMASNIMSISLGRLLVSGIAFLIYALLFPQYKKWFMVHFMIHYLLFTFFEIVFLLKIVNLKSPNK